MDLTTPLNIHWELTNACNLRCAHCYQQDDGPRQPVPSTEISERIAKRIVEAGVFEVTMTGGEILLVPNVVELVGYFNEHGLRPHLTSNGMLVDERIARRLASVDVTYQISMDAASADAHNDLRRSRRAFMNAVRGVRLLRAAGVDVSIAYTATPNNLDQVGALLDLASDVGASRVCIGEVLPQYGDDAQRSELTIAPTDYEAFLRSLLAVRNERAGSGVEIAVALQSASSHCSEVPESPCTALTRDLAILHDGYAYPCPFVRSGAYRLGNVLTTPIAEIWSSSNSGRRFRRERDAGAPKHCTQRSFASPVPVSIMAKH